MKCIYKSFLILLFLISTLNLSFANEKTAFIDIDYLIQNSNIGKKVLTNINDLNQKNLEKLEKKNKNLKNIEITIKSKKNVISEEEFNNEVKVFQQKVNDYKKEKDQMVKEFNDFRKKELENLLKLFNPIITNYMKQNSINMLLDSKNVFMANADSNLTKNILKIINDKIK